MYEIGFPLQPVQRELQNLMGLVISPSSKLSKRFSDSPLNKSAVSGFWNSFRFDFLFMRSSDLKDLLQDRLKRAKVIVPIEYNRFRQGVLNYINRMMALISGSP
jgi:hypothetical protein